MDSRQHIFNPSYVLHPGETIVEYLEFYGWSQRDLARRTGITPKTISEICNGKASISPSTALAFEKVFKRPAHLWLNLQCQYDEAIARREEAEQLANWNNWARDFPIQEMKRLNFSLPSGQSDTDILLRFFGVSSPKSWESVWEASRVAYRQTRKFNAKEGAIAAWVREAELIASKIDLANFDEGAIRSLVKEIRFLTRRRVDEAIEQVQILCATAGIAVVIVPELPQTAISGCTKWLSDKRVLIGLTLRYKTDDQLWFTLFHEIGHVLLHRNKHTFVVDNATEDLSDHTVDPEMQRYETEANNFAADTLIPPRDLMEFIRQGTFTNDSIHAFAESVSISPGIVVGRLQREGFLDRHQGNALKQKLSWKFKEE